MGGARSNQPRLGFVFGNGAAKFRVAAVRRGIGMNVVLATDGDDLMELNDRFRVPGTVSSLGVRIFAPPPKSATPSS